MGGHSTSPGDRRLTLDAGGVLDVIWPDSSGTLPQILSRVTLGTGFAAGPVITPFTAQTLGFRMVPGDVDADGDRDLILIHQGQTTWSYLSVLSAVGPATFTVQSFPGQYFPPYSLSELYAGDWNADGAVELLTRGIGGGSGSSYPNLYLIFGNDGTGVLSLTLQMPLDHPGQGGPGLVDLDQDGDVDFVGPADGLMNHGPLASNVTLAGTGHGLPFDLDQDGDPDLLSSIGSEYQLNDGTGRPTSANYSTVPLLGGGVSQNVSLGERRRLDLDLDGWLDEIVFVYDASFTHHTFLGGPDLARHYAGLTFSPPGLLVSVDRAEAGDFDGDGRRDLAIDAGLGIGLASPGSYALFLGLWPWHQVRGQGDAGGDGDLDVLVTTNGPLGATQRAGWLRNDGGYIFTPLTIPEPNLIPGAIHFADAGNDGDLDLIYLRTTVSQVTLVVAETQAGIPGPLHVLDALNTLGVYQFSVDSADLDLDGRLDLMVMDSDYQSNRVTVFRGTGPGVAFAPPITYTLSNVRRFLDLDGDGDMDGTGDGVALNIIRTGPAFGSRRQYGSGNAGTGGIAPVLGATGPVRPGFTVNFRARSFLGGAPALLTLGTQPANLPGYFLPSVTTYVWPWLGWIPYSATGGAAGIAGAGIWDLAVPIPPVLANQTFYLQLAFGDAGAPHGITATNGLEIALGQ